MKSFLRYDANGYFISFKLQNKIILGKRMVAFKTVPLEDMKKYLVEVLDKNQLYVNYSDIEDKTLDVSTDFNSNK